MRMMNWFFRILAFASAFGSGIAVALIDDAQIPSEQVEFFEKSVRPVLIEPCFECHSSDAEEVKAGLLVESRKALLASARRTIYMQVSRNGDHFRADEFMRLFDFPAMRATVSERLPNTVPQQYLFMMNNEYMLRRAELFASRLEKESPTVEQRIERAYRLLYSRLPTVEEQQAGLEFLIAGTATVRGVADDDKSRMARYLQVLLSSNEFMYLE